MIHPANLDLVIRQAPLGRTTLHWDNPPRGLQTASVADSIVGGRTDVGAGECVGSFT